MELPLSPLEIMASLSLSLSLIWLFMRGMVGDVLFVVGLWLIKLFEIVCRKGSHTVLFMSGSCAMAVWASNATVYIQFLCLYDRFYLRPLLSKFSSSVVNLTFVLLMTLG
jgi:hypothetical protein